MIGISLSIVRLGGSSIPVDYDLFVPAGSDSLITSDGNTFLVRSA